MKHSIKAAALSATALAAGLTGIAQAQQPDVITVTAQKREQTLQEVPIAVSVVQAETIQNAQIIDAIDTMDPAPHTFLKEVVVDWLTPREISDYQAAYGEYFEGGGSVH